MKTNLEKWNYYMDLLKAKAEVFMDGISPTIPEVFYQVSAAGKVYECKIIERHYSFGIYMCNKPDNKDVQRVKDMHEKGVEFNPDSAYFDYSYVWSVQNGKEQIATTAIRVSDVFAKETAFLSRQEAEHAAKSVKEICEANARFDATHAKDARYDYAGNGYKFLGWQNGWKHVYFDEDGNETTGDTSKGEKPKKSFGYRKQDYPEYMACVDLKHRTIEVHHDRRGCENTVSCPVCKIYWKYDSSD